MKISFVIPFVFFATAFEVYAEETKKTDKKVYSSDSITVVATKNPQNAFQLPITTAKVDMQKAQYASATTLSDIFRNTPGVELVGGPVRNAQQFSMRGYDANGIIFLLDGTRQNFISGHNSNIYLDPSLLKQVEIVKGSSSSIYGSGGLGGVISFETKDAVDLLKQGQKVGFMQKFGSYSANHEKSSVSTLYGASEKLDAIANVTLRDAGTLNLSNGTKYNAADSKVKSGMFKVNYAINDEQKLKFNVQSYKNNSNEYSNPQSVTASTSAFLTDKESTNTTTKLAYEYKPKNNKLVNFTTQAYNTDTEIEYKSLTQVSSSIPLGAHRAQKISTKGFDAQNVSVFDRKEALTHRVTYGLNYFQDRQSSDNQGVTWNLTPAGEGSVGGLFVQDEMKTKTAIGDFSIIPAARYDTYKGKATGYTTSSDEAFSPRLALGYMPTKWLNIFSNVGKSFRAPTTSERYSTGQHYPGNTFVPSPDLKAERNFTYEVGFGLNFSDILASNDNFKFKGAYFNTESSNYIGQEFYNFSMSPWPDYRNVRYINIGKANIEGVDLTAEYKVQKFAASVGYNYVNGKDGSTGRYLTTLLPRTLKTNFSYEFMQNSIVGLRSTFAEQFDTVNAGTSKTSGYTVHDVYTQYNYSESVAVSFAVNNLFNNPYRRPYTALYELGRDYRVTVSYKY